MCAMRRQLSGVVKYCWPVSCWPEETSQRRNSTLSRPSPWRVTRPVISPCALIVFQSGKRGSTSKLVIFSMYAAGSIGANSPERRRLAAITCVMPRATSVSPGVPPTKSGIAIGNGCTLPWVTSSRSCAEACIESSAPAEAAAPSVSNRRRVNRGRNRSVDVMGIQGLSGSVLPAEHVTRIEIDDDILPGFVLRRRKERVGRAGTHCAQRALGCSQERRMTTAVHQARLGEQASILLELDAHRHDQVARFGNTHRYVPALAQPRAQRVDFILRQRHGRSGRGTERRLVVQCLAGCHVALRIALVEQGRDSACVELRLWLRGLNLLLLRFGFLLRLWIGLFRIVFLKRLGDRIDLLLRLLGERLLRLGLSWRQRHRRLRLGLLLFLRRLRRLHLICGRDDLGFVVDDLGGLLFDRLCFGDLFDQRLRRFGLRRCLGAVGDLREVARRDDVG